MMNRCVKERPRLLLISRTLTSIMCSGISVAVCGSNFTSRIPVVTAFLPRNWNRARAYPAGMAHTRHSAVAVSDVMSELSM